MPQMPEDYIVASGPRHKLVRYVSAQVDRDQSSVQS